MPCTPKLELPCHVHGALAGKARVSRQCLAPMTGVAGGNAVGSIADSCELLRPAREAPYPAQPSAVSAAAILRSSRPGDGCPRYSEAAASGCMMPLRRMPLAYSFRDGRQELGGLSV